MFNNNDFNNSTVPNNTFHIPQEIVKKSFFLKLIKIFIFVFFLGIVLYFASNLSIPILKNKIQIWLQNSLNTEVSLDKVEIDILTKSIALKDLIIKNSKQFSDKNDDLLTVNKISISLDLFNLLHKKIIISKITLDKPVLFFYQMSDGRTNIDFIWPKNNHNTKSETHNNAFLFNAFLIKNGKINYTRTSNSEKKATAELQGIFLFLNNIGPNSEYIGDIPLPIKIKGRAYLPSQPKSIVNLSGYINNYNKKWDFIINIYMKNISLTYFNDFYPENSSIKVINGKFQLQTQAKCINNNLDARPNVTINDLQLKLTSDYSTSNVFELPVSLVVDFFDIYKEELIFSFDVNGTLTDPKFHLEDIVKQKSSEIIGESILRKIKSSPALIEKFGDRLLKAGTKLKEWGLDLTQGTGTAVKQLGKPVTELIKGLKGE